MCAHTEQQLTLYGLVVKVKIHNNKTLTVQINVQNAESIPSET